MRTFAIALVASGVSALIEQGKYDLFLEWAAVHGKSYGDLEDFRARFANFNENFRSIMEINNRPDMTSIVGLNKFADWSKDERLALLTYKPKDVQDGKVATFLSGDIPDSIDWRELGAVNPVRDQGNCGSCWAFSAVAAMEGQHYIQSGDLVDLAEQQCVDCDPQSHGCNGGWQDNCMYYVQFNGGMTTEDDYPYTANTDYCVDEWDVGPVQVEEVYHVKTYSEQALLEAIANGPTSITIEASSDVFHFYTGGVITEGCGSNLDHGIAAVGYGTTDDGTDYYICRNSWGADWGEDGYVRIGRNGDGVGVCGIQQVSVWALTN